MNYEQYRSAIDRRISNRRFTGVSPDENQIEKLKELVSVYNEESGLSMQLIIGDTAPFDGKQASGMFQGSAGYLAFVGKTNDPDRMEKEGYYGEKFVLEAVSMGLGTCWVASSFDKEKSKATLEADQTLDLAVVFGMAEKKLSIKEKMIRTVLGRNARTIEDIAPDMKNAPEWFKKGAECAMKAPSTKNTRPFVFTHEGGKTTAHTVGNHERVMVDLGIAKLHFEVGARSGKWDLGDGAQYNNL